MWDDDYFIEQQSLIDKQFLIAKITAGLVILILVVGAIMLASYLLA